MYPYWDSIIEPVLSCLGTRSIVEIGTVSGRTTRLLLRFWQRQAATPPSRESKPVWASPPEGGPTGGHPLVSLTSCACGGGDVRESRGGWQVAPNPLRLLHMGSALDRT